MKREILIWVAGILSADGTIQRTQHGALRYRIYSQEKLWLQHIQRKLSLIGIKTTINEKHGYLHIWNPQYFTSLIREYAQDYLMQRKAKQLKEARYEFEPISETEIDKLINDPVYFNERLFNVRFYPYQKEILRSIQPKRKIIVLKGRKIGITFAAACAALWWAATHSFHIISIVSLFKRQAKVTLRFIQKLLYKNPEIMHDLIDLPYGMTKETIRFNNGSIIQALGCNRPYGDNLRSEEAHFLIVDECILFYDKQWNAIEPLTAHSHGPAIYISTAGGEGSYFHRVVELAKSAPDHKLFILPACKRRNGEITNILCPDMDLQRLQNALKELKPLAFDREYCCQWVGLANQVFTKIPLLKLGMSLQVEPTYLAGIDVGQVENPTVLTVIKGSYEKAKVIFTREWRRAPSNRILAQNIYKALIRFNPLEVIVDRTGSGIGLYQELEDTPLPIYGIDIKPKMKNRLIFDLQAALNEECLYIDERQEQLLYELRNYFAELIKGSELYKFTCVSTDDYVDSLALAWHGIERMEKAKPIQLKMEARGRRIF